MLCAQEDVTVLQTDAPYNKYENTMKRYLAERFSSGRWNLCADIDELFDYPFSESLSLRDFLGYLNTQQLHCCRRADARHVFGHAAQRTGEPGRTTC